jgi:hypothetical protein
MGNRDVRVVAFDVNETLFSLDSLGPVFARGSGPGGSAVVVARLDRSWLPPGEGR